jgi:hypothetical protein
VAASAVAELHVRLRVPAQLAGSAAHLRSQVERELLRRVLDELERLLDARFGGRALVRVRRLSLRWRLEAGELAAAAAIARLAQDVAELICAELAALAPAEQLRPRAAVIALFSSDLHAAASDLADRIDAGAGQAAAPDLTASACEIFRGALARGAQAAQELVQWLRRMERLEPALACLDAALSEQLAVCVPALSPALNLARARRDLAVRAAVAALRPSDEALSSVAPGLALPRGAPDSAATPTVQADAARAATADEVPAALQTAPGDRVRAASPGAAAARASEPPADGAPSAPLAAGPAAHEASAALATRAAGLFYLAGRVLEIELAERLWAAGLPEGDVLALMVSALLDFDDVACRWFGGLFTRGPGLPEIESWACVEITEGVQHALGRRLVDFGVVLSPARLRAQLDALGAQLELPAALSPLLGRIVTHGLAALSCVVGARLRREPSLAELRGLCLRPGQLILAPEALHVLVPHAMVDVDHRRAGLDHDPGYVPWLARQLRFEFTGGSIE